MRGKKRPDGEKLARRDEATSWNQHHSRSERLKAAAGAAWALILALPAHIPVPAMSVDDDGDIAFDWDLSNDRVLSLSVSPTGRIGYASLFGTEAAHGHVQWSESVPEGILCHLLRLFPLPDTTPGGGQ